tara:strand:- start:5049 stop:5834 length:786 start_codon:yes stop_codon:yes gene_type:complete
MKKIYLLGIVLLFSCGAEEFEPDNPIDPDNPDYIPPIVSIVSGFPDGQVITSSSITVSYSGNEPSMLFRTKLDTNDWSGWITAESFTLDHLDEDEHVFYLQGKYTTGDTSEVIMVPFTVDAVEGPSLLFYPRRRTLNTGESVTFHILAEEVFELAGTGFALDYNPSKIRIDDVRQGDVFAGTGTPIFFSEIDQVTGKITISTAIWDGSGTTFTGTGVIIEIDAVLLQDGNSDIEFDGSEVFRDRNNNEILLNESIGGLMTN